MNNHLKNIAATVAMLTTLAANTHAQDQQTAVSDSTTGSTIRWEGRRFEPIYKTDKGGRYLARTNRQGIYYRKFIKDEEQ